MNVLMEMTIQLIIGITRNLLVFISSYFKIVKFRSPTTGSGAISMKEKLCTYAQSNLPGGIYWETDEHVKKVLSELKPSNDLCESILGLNDYLVTAIPNLHQSARSTLVQTKNKIIKWLDKLSSEQQLDLAIESRAKVELECKQRSEQSKSERQEKPHQHQENGKEASEIEKPTFTVAFKCNYRTA